MAVLYGQPVRDRCARPGPVPVPVANTLAVLRAAYVMLDRGSSPHRASETEAIVARLKVAFDRY